MTFVALAAMFAGHGCWQLLRAIRPAQVLARFVDAVGGVCWSGLWIAFRVVNMPTLRRFFDLGRSGDEQGLVAEPRSELFRASMVVMLSIFVLAAMLFGYDLMWEFLLGWLFR